MVRKRIFSQITKDKMEKEKRAIEWIEKAAKDLLSYTKEDYKDDILESTFRGAMFKAYQIGAEID